MPTMETVNHDSLYTLLKGEPGTRKSTAALSYPTPQYWFSYDKKMEALILPMKHFGIKPTDITYDDYTDWNKARVKLEQLQVACPYKTIIIDSITSMGDSINRQTMKTKSGTTRSSGDEAGKRIGGIPVNTMEDFNAETSAFQEMIALTKEISAYHKVNIVLIAHVIRTDEKDTSGKVHVARTLVTGGKKIAAKIPAYCTEIYHFNIESDIVVGKGGQYALLTEHAGEDYARTSLPLANKIIFGSEPLYGRYIEPAIKKLKEQIPITKF